jgi:hypothetical protein
MRSNLDIKPFPDDFFCTLNLSNIRNGPRVNKVIYRQVKKNSKSLSRVCKREKSLDVNESYLLATPDVRIKPNSIKFPSIHRAEIDHNSTMVRTNAHRDDLDYSVDYDVRQRINQKRLNKYMGSEERFRKTKKLMFAQDNIFDFETQCNKIKYNSPMRKYYDLIKLLL